MILVSRATKKFGTKASIEQLIFQISSLSNEIKTLKYLPPVQAVYPEIPLYILTFENQMQPFEIHILAYNSQILTSKTHTMAPMTKILASQNGFIDNNIDRRTESPEATGLNPFWAAALQTLHCNLKQLMQGTSNARVMLPLGCNYLEKSRRDEVPSVFLSPAEFVGFPFFS